ncbi:MAG: ketoacyl-ACP synthase III [Muribaculaceae bacterium]|nr:ketoacyl-ACP synthase III [Muribaculaceae bacterium]
MAFIEIPNVRIAGVSAAVPKKVKEIKDLPFFAEGEAEKVIALTHVERSRIVPEGMVCSDLCYEAAEKLIAELGWDKSEIDGLIFVSLSRDYITPATAAVLQERLGLSQECYAIDIPLACSGYLYGLSVAGSLITASGLKKVLLLVGETTSLLQSPQDKVLWPLHGDAGTATALQYDENAEPMKFNLRTDGSRAQAIINTDGGVRNPVTEDSLVYREYEPGVIRNRVQSTMDGLGVFGFSVKEPPASILDLCLHYGIDIDAIDYLILHQANKYMDDKIAKKVKVSLEKVPFSLMQYGNTSSATIPVTTVVCLHEEVQKRKVSTIACGFGSGLSWASASLVFDNIVCPPLIEVGE